MSGKGDNKIKDTPEQKMLAQVGAEQWNFSQETLGPLQDLYISQVDDANSEARQQFVSGAANIGAQNAAGAAVPQMAATAQANGLNLQSSTFKGGLADTYLATATSGGDTAARGLHELQSSQVQGLQNVAAMGSGQEMQAVAGLGDVASMSAQNARSNAMNAFSRRSANLQTLGSLAGAGTSHYMSQQAGINMQGQSTPLTNNTAFVKNM